MAQRGVPTRSRDVPAVGHRNKAQAAGHPDQLGSRTIPALRRPRRGSQCRNGRWLSVRHRLAAIGCRRIVRPVGRAVVRGRKLQFRPDGMARAAQG